MVVGYFLGEDFAFPATLYAIAAACFGGFPAAISVLMFFWMVLEEEPFWRGMSGL